MLDGIKDCIASARKLGGKELFGTMKDLINDVESDFDKIVEGTNDEDTINNLRGKLGAVSLLSVVVGEKVDCLKSADIDKILDALPDIVSNLKIV